jgi:hypothetical protein
MQIHTDSAEFREKSTIIIPRNSVKFRGIPCVFQKIPHSDGSEKSTSVDTLATNYESRSDDFRSFCLIQAY